MRDYTENDIDAALDAMAGGLSSRKASSKFGIPRSTLVHRANGTQQRSLAFEHRQKLSATQEKNLTDWIRVQGSLGLPPTHAQVRVFAASLMGAPEQPSALGKNWLSAFLRRNPEIKVQRCRSIDAKRVNGASEEVIKAWFPRLHVPEIHDILPENCWNMDETGFTTGQGDSRYAIGTPEKKKMRKNHGGNRTWTSTVECVSATGKSLPPLVIYKGKSVQQQWFATDLEKYAPWQFTSTENGWTTNATAVEWLRDLFLPCSVPSQPRAARLLIIDGHGSHETDEFMRLCMENNVYLLVLPPHASHVLQPLDLTVFSPLKSAYRKHMGEINTDDGASVASKAAFLECYYKARESALTERNIRSGWLSSGLWPVNEERPLSNSYVLHSPDTPSTPKKSHTTESASPRALSEGTSRPELVVWTTPKKSQNIALQARRCEEGNLRPADVRAFMRKVQKGFDEVVYHSALRDAKFEALEATVEALRPRKRKRVVTSPESSLATIKHIQSAQIAAGEKVELLDDSCEEGDLVEPENL